MSTKGQITGQEILESIDHAIKKEFETNRRILSFKEYLVLFGEQPKNQLRGTARYMIDMMDHFGTTPLQPQDHMATTISPRFKLFDLPIDGLSPKVVGQEKVQNQIYRALHAFARQGLSNKLILLHGPNGSAKSSIIHAIMGGMERYSKDNAGAIYTFNWIFPVERFIKGGIGIQTYSSATASLDSFSKLSDEEISAKIPCDLKDHPLLIIPPEHRKGFLEKLIGKNKSPQSFEDMWAHAPHYLREGNLCLRCKQIFDALLTANGGDFNKLLMHIQVERLYFATRYRKGLVTIEPQMHVDAQTQQLTTQYKNLAGLPPSLQSLNLFTVMGDLIDGNRGIVEYSDLLKRPVDTFKYLLTACETGAVNIGNSIAYLDTIMLGSTNEIQLDAFKEFPDFTSFKARIELIRVPYLLNLKQEQEIYLHQLPQMAGDKHVAPHTAWTVALWAILTRLKKPNSINYPPTVSHLISNLVPLEKAKIYSDGSMPSALSPEDKKLLRSAFRKLREEYLGIPYYEGRLGASAREIKSILFDAAQNPEFQCLSPLAVLRELEEFVKRVSEYEFLKQDVKDGYHDSIEFIQTVRNEYLNKIDEEVRNSMGIYEVAQWEDFLKKYILQVSTILKKEKVKNPMTGKMEDPDFGVISEFEKIVDAPTDTIDREAFRNNIISQVGAWSLDHPGLPVVYANVFPEFWKKLEKYYFESQKALLTKMSNSLLVYNTDADDPNSEGGILARKTIENMKNKLGYCQECAKEVITFLMKQKY